MTIDFINANTGSTGAVTVTVRLQVAGGLIGAPQGSVTSAVPTGVSAGWVAGTPTGSDTDRTFTFTRAAPGIVGTSGATGAPVTTTLSFTATITRSALGRSAGDITVTTVAASGSVAPGVGTWT